ncbi:epidermal growth factor receptor kinase substrate 8-like protein 1a isoform X1 [Cyprinus carpio]|uniref:Epidermal growth factor receptor kinase substrate 8-like protein 1a isoform X1 n=2 Tax=Cyprinus carpio TaxID=7962 RepID=A0A8C1IYL6_CYPCA|nr:epidermal growth factor receptor kinase substrate 8-like protein 1a isoform X1 [Cyprinus carpio]
MAAPTVIPRRQSKSTNDTAANSHPIGVNALNGGDRVKTNLMHAQREVDLVNHCFADVERFMARLQETAEAKNILEQQSIKKNSKKNEKKKTKKKKEQDDGPLTRRVTPPSEQEFVDIFQKIKYSLCLLDRLKMKISEPTSEELLHHVFIPLHLMVKTTGGPELAATVSSPAMTSGAISLLQQNLNEQEKPLWKSLGPNWTVPYSQLSETVPQYTPVFLDGWQPMAIDAHGQPIEDPLESQHKHEALMQTQQVLDQAHLSVYQEHDGMEDSLRPHEERLYRCSYDFVARNSSELSVLHGETLEVLESSKRWWKCKNEYGQIGFVPHNILEPINHSEVDSSNVVMHNQSMKAPIPPPGGGRVSCVLPSSTSKNAFHPDPRPHSMPPIGDAFLMNDELLQRLANGKSASIRPVVINKANETTAPLDYHSPPAEVQGWLRAKGFHDYTVQGLGVLTGAQLFSLNKEELRSVCPEEGTRVYSQIMVQKALLEDKRKATELEAIMKKQKMKVDLKAEGGEF